MQLNNLVQEIFPIAQKAGEEIMSVYTQISSISIEMKKDKSPVTEADKKANKIICDGLKKLAVQYPIISEENKGIDYDERKSFETFWLVDPLDGTKEFIKKNDDFTVNIALVKGKNVVLGVVYIPVTKELYFATKDGGAFQIIEGKNQALKAAKFKLEYKGLKFTCSRSHLDEQTKSYVNKFDSPEMVSRGSSLKFLLLAKGETHIYPRYAPTMEWDTAAAQIIVEESGGSVISQKTQKPLIYNKEVLRNPNFIAYGNLKA